MQKLADLKKYHVLYKTTCVITGKFYVGMHSTNNLDDSYLGSGQRLWRSIRKHGRENHVRVILECLESRKLLELRESQVVNDVLLSNPLCLNLKPGGSGGFTTQQCELAWKAAHSPEVEKRRSETRKLRGTDSKENNNSWGTCWVTHPELGNKRIKREELELYLSDDWKQGRKMPPGFGKAQSLALKGRKRK